MCVDRARVVCLYEVASRFGILSADMVGVICRSKILCALKGGVVCGYNMVCR